MKNFTCPFCEKTYEDRDVYVKCVNTCSAKEKQREEEIRQKKLQDEVASRKKDLKDTLTFYLDQLNAFAKDYPDEVMEFEFPNLRLFSTGDSFVNEILKGLEHLWQR